MSSEPDYNFNQPASSTSSEGGMMMIPFTLLVAAIGVIMVAQTYNVFKAHGSLVDNKKKFDAAIVEREKVVEQSKQLQQRLESIVLDLLLLAKTDQEADKIVKKYNIQQQNPAGGAAPAPAPAPAEAPK